LLIPILTQLQQIRSNSCSLSTGKWDC